MATRLPPTPARQPSFPSLTSVSEPVPYFRFNNSRKPPLADSALDFLFSSHLTTRLVCLQTRQRRPCEGGVQAAAGSPRQGTSEWRKRDQQPRVSVADAHVQGAGVGREGGLVSGSRSGMVQTVGT